jgi:hypothetical protein
LEKGGPHSSQDPIERKDEEAGSSKDERENVSLGSDA